MVAFITQDDNVTLRNITGKKSSHRESSGIISVLASVAKSKVKE